MMMIHNYSLSHRRRLGNPYYRKVLGYNPIAYWPLWEPAGGVAECLVNPAQSGAYTGVTLGQEGIGDGRTAPFFDGANDFVDIYSASFEAALSFTEFTIMLWLKVNAAGVWTDGAKRVGVMILDDGNNYITLNKAAANNTVEASYKAGGAWKNTSHAGMAGVIDWFTLGMTVSVGADALKLYVDGAPQGTVAGLGVWAGGALNVDRVLIGATSKPGEVAHGWHAHCAVWDTPLTPAQIADLAVMS